MDRIRNPIFYFFAALCLAIAALRLLQDLLIPFALATLLSFLLAPAVSMVQRVLIKRLPSVLLVTLLAFSVLGGVGWAFTHELGVMAKALPEYTDNIRSRVKAIRSSGSGIFLRFRRSVDDVAKEIKTVTPRPGEEAAGPRQTQPPNDQNKPPQGSFLDSMLSFVPSLLGSILASVGLGVIIIVLVVFMLMQREDLRDRMIRIIGEGRLRFTTDALDEAAERVSKFLAAQFAINFGYGVSVMAGLYLLGVPNAALWGVLSGAFRFVPYIGAWIAAVFPLFLSLAVSPGWTLPLSVLGFFVALEFVTGNVVEPLLFGHLTGLSPFAVLIAAIFWSWAWGGVGLLMSTPLTVSLVVLGKYAPSLRFISILFGDEPALLPHVRLYQRILALDLDEAAEITSQLLQTKTLQQYYEEVLIPALLLAEDDIHAGIVTDKKRDDLLDGFREIVDEAERSFLEKSQTEPGSRAGRDERAESPVLLLPSREPADEIASEALAKLLSLAGIRSVVAPIESLVNEMAALIERSRPQAIVISALHPESEKAARYLCKKIAGRTGGARVFIGLWRAGAAARKRELLSLLGDRVVVFESFTEALNELRQTMPVAEKGAA